MGLNAEHVLFACLGNLVVEQLNDNPSEIVGTAMDIEEYSGTGG